MSEKKVLFQNNGETMEQLEIAAGLAQAAIDFEFRMANQEPDIEDIYVGKADVTGTFCDSRAQLVRDVQELHQESIQSAKEVPDAIALLNELCPPED